MEDPEPGSLAFIPLISKLSSSASSPTCRPALPFSCLLLICPIRPGGLLPGAHTGLTCSKRHCTRITEQLEPSSPPSCFKLHPEGTWWAPGQDYSRLPIQGPGTVGVGHRIFPPISEKSIHLSPSPQLESQSFALLPPLCSQPPPAHPDPLSAQVMLAEGEGLFI